MYFRPKIVYDETPPRQNKLTVKQKIAQKWAIFKDRTRIWCLRQQNSTIQSKNVPPYFDEPDGKIARIWQTSIFKPNFLEMSENEEKLLFFASI